MAFVAGGVATGAIGWSGHVMTLPVGLAFPALWAFAPSRLVAALVALAHFLGASRGLPEGTANFFGAQLAIGIAFWFAASLMFVVIHACLWTPKPGWRTARYAIAVVLMSVPPFGIVGWAHPITAAGVLLPGWGWIGLGVTTAGMLVLTSRAWPAAALAFASAYAHAIVNSAPMESIYGWSAIDTEFGAVVAGYSQQLQTIALVKRRAKAGAKVVVLPESSLGYWNSMVQRLWHRELAGLDVTVIGGGLIVDSLGYENVMIEMSAAHAGVLYSERMPVPVSMWQPWTTGGAHAKFFANPVVEVAGYRAAPLICYEQLIIWPVLQSMLSKPDVIIATGNGWWTGDTNIIAIQRASAEAWASLFAVPLVLAFNR